MELQDTQRHTLCQVQLAGGHQNRRQRRYRLPKVLLSDVNPGINRPKPQQN